MQLLESEADAQLRALLDGMAVAFGRPIAPAAHCANRGRIEDILRLGGQNGNMADGAIGLDVECEIHPASGAARARPRGILGRGVTQPLERVGADDVVGVRL